MTLHADTAKPKTTVFLLGVSTVVAQALLLREAMAAMGGSELAWGTVMALWLIGMGLGSRIGTRFGSMALATWMPVTTIVLAGSAVVLFRASPALVGAAPGEVLTTASATWLWVVAVIPAALAGGIAFPILAEAMGPSGGGRAYAIEGVGALVGGGAISLILMGLGSAAALCVTLSLLLAASLWRRTRASAVIVGIAGFAIAPIAADSLAQAGWHWSGNPGELQAWKETRLQRLEASSGPPTNLFADGRLVASYPDPYVVLPRAHLAMLLHPNPARVFAVGCVADGSVEAMARHPVEELVVVEEDPVVLRNISSWYGAEMEAALSKPQVRPVTSDPLRAISDGGPWDLVILRDGNPTTIRRNRTRTLEFLRRCRARMSADGILVMRVVVSDTYLGGAAGSLVTTLAATVREVFPKLEALPGEEILLIAGGPDAEIELDADHLAARLQRREVANAELVPEMIPLFVDPERAIALADRIEVAARINTIRRPRAVMLAGALHEGQARPSLIRLVLELEQRGAWPLAVIVGTVCLALLAMTVVRRPPIATTAATVGLASMGWWLLLIATWQATRGSVYSEVGALTAIFMAGLAVGAGLATLWPRPALFLPTVLAAGSALSLLVATGAAIRLPLAGVPAFLAVGGGLTGAAFPGLVSLSRRDTRRSTGIAFAADEIGAAAGALVVGIVAIPWAGLTATALGLAAVELAAVPAVMMALRRSRPRDS